MICAARTCARAGETFPRTGHCAPANFRRWETHHVGTPLRGSICARSWRRRRRPSSRGIADGVSGRAACPHCTAGSSAASLSGRRLASALCRLPRPSSAASQSGEVSSAHFGLWAPGHRSGARWRLLRRSTLDSRINCRRTRSLWRHSRRAAPSGHETERAASEAMPPKSCSARVGEHSV